MSLRSVAVAALMMISLVACGDDDNDKDEVLKGHVADWTVSGLHYATETQSGLTSASGEFSYKSGEDVTFAIGSTTLATVKGAERITLFDMFGITPPRTELEIRAARVGQVTQPFDRVANVASLLFALDVDHDPTNGIDLAEWDTTLAQETLSIEAKPDLFVFRQIDRIGAAYPGIHRQPSVPAIVMLYDTLSIRVPAHAVATTVTAEGGVDTSRTIFAYDSRGRVLVERYDRNLDGADDNVYTMAFNTSGQQVSAIYESDDDSNGSLELREAYDITYGPLGVELTSFSTRSTSGVATIRQGRTSTYDARGNLQLEAYTADAGVNGSIDSREDTTWSRDARGLPISETTESFSTPSGPATYRRVTQYLHDAAGRPTSEREELDSNADGVLESIYTELYTYDDQGRVLTSAREFRDGTGVMTSRSQRTFTYDAVGNLAVELYESDGDANGVVDNRSTTTTSFNSNGQVLVSTEDEDVGANGTIDTRHVRTWTYDNNGLVLRQVRETDDGLNGVEQSTTITWAYDANGALLTTTESSMGSIGGPRTVTNTLTVLDDGLVYLFNSRDSEGGGMAD